MREFSETGQVEWNEMLSEREELAIERIQSIVKENELTTPYSEFFVKEAKFLLLVREAYEKVCDGSLSASSLEELEQWNERLYEDIKEETYAQCYGNPEYAVKIFGEPIGRQLCFLYAELRGLIVPAFEKRRYDLLIYFELFIEIYCYFTEVNEETCYLVKSAIRYFVNDYCSDMVDNRIEEMLDPKRDFAVNIIMNSDLSDPKYLYQFGEYIGENERKISAYLAAMSEEKIEDMARTYTEGFRQGFISENIDLSKKSVVNIRYSVGFERMVRAAIKQFKAMGLDTVIYRTAFASINKNQNAKIGYFSSSINRQYDYDHRFDDAIYLNKAFIAKKLEVQKASYEKRKELARQFAGPAVIETFGEKEFFPVKKEEAYSLSEHQQELMKEYRRESKLISKEYLPSDEYSFTIIAYPIPEIGKDFDAIFAETVKVNTLDVAMYREIQTKMIEALDEGEFVHILGKAPNHTDIMISLHEIGNKEKETNFENCLADVNIPVGEAFTSPKLTGTNGCYHVSTVYLNGLKYKDLSIQFKDGMIADYTCKNFETEEENKAFVKENVLYNQETLPMGEFAIGTNTTAYKMGRTYHIEQQLPILIAEKTGPHIAVGDTCYSMAEENKTYNPDGKEIIAKDNECSELRKTDITKAYFSCHTDITIPYDELQKIEVVKKDQSTITIIENGRFVLAGTEQLNEALDSL
ncbi:MAG: aminopeptidase [bacterium]|nr:aminopeptidase [bacterium]